MDGIWKSISPPGALMSIPASAGKFVCRKSSLGRVTRTDPAFVTVCATGKPPISGFEHPPQPLELPPPLHDATIRNSTTMRAFRDQIRSMEPPKREGRDTRNATDHDARGTSRALLRLRG